MLLQEQHRQGSLYQKMDKGVNMQLLEDIRKSFIDESINSPILLSDLASMEKYIAESYSGRSLIELLQNADDAGASEFFINRLDIDTLIVANNGRPFNDADVISLCRSGSSTKKRKASTIGFRGIGFKSVVNYSDEVYLVSGGFKILFSRLKTKECLNTSLNVPLIRIPHEFQNSKYDDDIKQLLKRYNTVFIFKTTNSSFDNEVTEFDESCLLFLNNVQKVIIGNSNLLYYNSKHIKLSNNLRKITLESNKSETNDWLIFEDKKISENVSIAFKLYGNKVIPANSNESVIHSFMPTKNKLIIPFKVNGDFSTDPSRTQVVIDEETNKAIDECVQLISSLISQIYKDKEDPYEILNILSYIKQDPLSSIRGKNANDIIMEHLIVNIKKELFVNSCTKPLDIEIDDFEKICKQLNYIPIVDSYNMPYLTKFAQAIGVKELTLEDSLKAMSSVDCSELTRAEILNKTIKQTKFGLSNTLNNVFCNAKIFTSKNKIVPIKDISSYDDVSPDFIELSTSKLDSLNDYQNFIKKFGLSCKENVSIQNIRPTTIVLPSIQKSKTKTIKKWRSVEKNVLGVLETIKNNHSVLDVSEQNLGYDIEVITTSGEKELYEVKSVDYFGEPISITNNEYTTANQYKDSYILAITCQTDNDIEICFIRNPIECLSLTKRIVRWEWICNQYNGKTIRKSFDLNSEEN